MLFDVKDTNITGLRVITPKIFKDHRGEFVETWNYDRHPFMFIRETDLSVSKKGVFRGFHLDKNAHKLVQCIHGKIQLVVIECSSYSKSFGEIFEIVLDDETRQQVFIPAYCAIGHLVLSDKAIFAYKQNLVYDRDRQFTLDYRRVPVEWKLDPDTFILSGRDSTGPFDDLYLPERCYARQV